MYKTILTIHCVWAFATLLLLAVAVINALAGASSKTRVFSDSDRRLSLFALIATHLQFVFGIILYFVSPNGIEKIQALGMAGMQSYDRLLALEHPFVNLLAVILITVGWSRHKKAALETKFKSISIFYGLGLLALLSRIPWSTWLS